MRLSGPACLAAMLLSAHVVQAQQGTYDWANSKALFDGVAYAHMALELENAHGLVCKYYDGFSPDKPRKLSLHVMRIDTKEPKLRLADTGRADGWGETMPNHDGENLGKYTIRTKRETTVDFMRRHRKDSQDMLVAVNAQPWSPFESGVAHPYADRLGLTVSGGLLVSPPNGGPSLVVRKDGGLDMVATDDDSNLSEIELAVTGFSFCLVDGKPTPPDKTLHPRTGYGLCREKRFLYLLVIDGRQDASQGATVHEVGVWLRHYGAYTGINMDGGGSTTMTRWNPAKKKVEILNRPSGGEPRKVGSNLAVYSI